VGEERLPLTVEAWSDRAADQGEGIRHVAVDWSAVDAVVDVAGHPDPVIWPA